MMNPEKEARLKELRQRASATAAKVRELEARQDAENRLQAEIVALEDQEALAAALEQHSKSDIRQIKTDAGCIIVKQPSAVLYKRFRNKADATSDALYGLVSKCLVHPSADEFDKILERYPAALDRCADAVVVLAGFREKAIEGK